jgi:hypothetical protein
VSDEASTLTAFQTEVALAFFDLPASSGFLLAGGAALLAQQLTTRPTQDLDFFTQPGAGDVAQACNEFVAQAASRGWTVETIRVSEGFCRLLVHGMEDLLIDIALDSAPGRPLTVSVVGPTFAIEELAGRKVVALFDRAAARDFVDVYMLSQRFAKNELVALAHEVDAGFELDVFADMIANIDRYSDTDLDLGGIDVSAVRGFFAAWIDELRAGSSQS